ncbi:hypothetical protein C5C17_00320 [Pseudoclavibacter sp. RFBA6]|nr:hypothetical protein C5C17_00320 [Pseudoclavibacter sp. RFBA6]
MAQRGLLMQPIRSKIVRFLVRQAEPVTVPEIAASIEVDYHPTLRHVKELVAMGWMDPVLKAEDNIRRYTLNIDSAGEAMLEYVHDTLGESFDELLRVHLDKTTTARNTQE